MRLSLIIFLSISISSSAQSFLNFHSMPGGYSVPEIRQRNQLKIDPQDNVWVAFEKIGAGKYDGNSWVVYDSLNSGIPSNTVYDLAFDGTGNTWFATKRGLAKFDGSTWTVYNTQNSGLPTDTVIYLFVDGNEVWMGSYQGAVHFDGSVFTSYDVSNSGIASNTVRQIIKSSSGEMYFATFQGLSAYDGNSWVTYNSSNSIISTNNLFTLQTDGMNRIWFGASTILYYLENGIVKNFIGDLYTDLVPLTPTVQLSIGKNNSGGIYFFENVDELLIEVNENDISYYYFSPSNTVGGLGFTGCDSQGSIWQIPRLSNDTLALGEIDKSNYVLPAFLPQLTIHNSKTLNINEVRALMLNRGDMFWDLDDPAYEVPKGSGKNANYAAALWIGGLDQGGNLHTAVQSYRQSGHDYWPGPIDGITLPFDSTSCAFYDKMYSVYKWKIEEFKTNFQNGSVSNGTYLIDEDMLKWPANGNNGITDDKAPFVDYNNDNLYNPFDGDYPLIKGDQMIFWMFNDSLAEHSVPTDSSLKLGVEVHASAYAYSCPGIADSNQVVNTTTLYSYRIINRSNIDYDSIFVGLWNSGLLGYPFDNYMGCDSTNATAFVYNGDNDDDTINSGYGLNPPMQNLVILKGMLADSGDGTDNDLDGVIDELGERTAMNYFISADGDPSGPTSNPAMQIHYYYYMQSIWLDGQHLTYGDDGRNPGNPPTNFMFSGTPYGNAWTEYSAGNVPEERKFVASSGPVSLAAGGELTIDFAYVFTRDTTGPNGLTTSIARNTADIQRVRSWFDNDNFPGCIVYSVGEPETQILPGNLKLFPNPVINVLNFSDNSELMNAFAEVIDVTGRVIIKRKLSREKHLDVSYLKSGVYTLRIRNEHVVRTGRFLKIQ